MLARTDIDTMPFSTAAVRFLDAAVAVKVRNFTPAVGFQPRNRLAQPVLTKISWFVFKAGMNRSS
jgi:hypothetical protein